MTKVKNTELENVGEWDWQTAETRRPAKQRRSIVSVAFDRADFDRVAACAGHQWTTVSGFIRTAALEKVDREQEFAPHGWTTGNTFFAVIHGVPESGTVHVGKNEVEISDEVFAA